MTKALLRDLLCAKLSDPALELDCDAVGATVDFSSAEHVVLDGTCTVGQECVVAFPSLRGAEGALKLKALVLPSDYSL